MAPCVIRNLQDLIACIEGAVEGTAPSRWIELEAGLFEEAGELAALFGGASLKISQRDAQTPLVTPSADDVRIVGKGRLFAGASESLEYELTVTGTYDAGPLLALKAIPLGSWTFAGNFPAEAFPPYLGFDPPVIAPQPSFIPGIAFESPSFAVAPGAKAIGFEADALLTSGSLAPLEEYLGPAPVHLSGTVALQQGKKFPKLELSGDLQGNPVPPPVIVSEPKLRIATVDAAGTPPGESVIQLQGSTSPGEYGSLDITAPLLRGPGTLQLAGEPERPADYSLASGLVALSDEVGLKLTLPTGLAGLGSLGMRAMVLGIRSLPSGRVIDLIGFRFGTISGAPPAWTAPIAGLSIKEIGIGWDVVEPFGDSPALLGQVTGKLGIGEVDLDLAVDIGGSGQSEWAPDVSFVVSLSPETPLGVKALFKQFTGADLGFDVLITDLLLAGQTGSRSLQFVAALEPKLTFKAPAELARLTLVFDYAPNAFAGELVAEVHLLNLPFLLRAAYAGEGKGWRFSGMLLPNAQGNKLQAMIESLGYDDPLPGGLGEIELRGLSARFSTLDSSFGFDGTLGWPLDFPTLGIKADIEAELALSRASETAPLQGQARGVVKVNDFALGVVYSFGVKGSSTLAFEVAFRQAVLTCVISEKNGNKILRANLGGVSFGDLLGYMVGLATGEPDFRLPAPWDVLYQLRFDRLWLEVDLKTKAVAATYDLEVDLGIVSIEQIGLKYSKYAGSPSVELSIAGEFAGTRFGEEEPLQWDVLNDPPPAPPGKGEQLLDLRYLGLGQNVALRQAKRFSNVLEVIETLEKSFEPVEPGTSPLSSLEALKFSGDGRWLIGADFTVMSAVSIAGVFADPSLYGLRIGLAGPRVKSLAGLQFEVLYQKVNDSIGLYHIELTLPTAMRQLQFGAVAVTLPIITVDIYTNGNFYLDFGFPAGGDYSRSFTVQAGIFTGAGGFYIGVLDGATSKQVPAVSNGWFSPVVEFGIGLAVGFGRTLDAGIVSGGLTVALNTTVQGVLGWFNPADRSLPTDLYYSVQGSAAIVGKAWGSVDFAVIKASFSITAFASVTLQLEAYEPTHVELRVGVEVSASVKIVFFTVSFSFTTTLDMSFTIGDGSQPPWQIVAPALGTRPLQLRRMHSRHRLRPARPLDLQRRELRRAGAAPSFDWSGRGVLAAGPVELDLMLAPTLTPALEEGGSPAVQIVMGLYLRTSAPPGALHADELRQVADPAAGEVPFNVLASGVLRWAISSVVTPLASAGKVTIAELDALGKFLADRSNRDATFTYERVVELIEENFVLRVSNPIDPWARQAEGLSPQVTVFPMIPEISMSPEGRTPVDFWSHAMVDQAYRNRLETYYDQLQVRPPSRGVRAAGTGEAEEALSKALFCDYFGLVAQQAVKQAAETLDAYPYEPTGKETLRQIAEQFGGWGVEHRVRRDETPAAIAAEYGVSLAELARANERLSAVRGDEELAPGSALTVEVGPSPGRIAAANRGYPLRPGAKLGIAGVRHQVRAGETLGRIAGAFEIEDPASLLAEEPENAASTSLLRPGAKLALPSVPYEVEAGDLLVPGEERERIAANFYVRGRQPLPRLVLEHVDWYVAAIGERAPAFSGTVKVPVVACDEKTGEVAVTGETEYAVKSSDTLEDVAAMFALLQLAPKDPGFNSYLAKLPAGPYRVKQVVGLPPLALALGAGDTPNSLAETFYLGPGSPRSGLEAIFRANAGTDVLAPRAVLAIPRFEYTAVAGDSLGSVAERLDLTVEQLAEAVAGEVAILAPYPESKSRLVVPHVAERDIDSLVADMTRVGAFNSLSAILSRFLLHGMRAPEPPSAGAEAAGEAPLRGLYEVAGQQFPGPTGASADYKVGFAKGSTASWFHFDSPVEGEGEAAGEGEELLMTLSPSFLAEHAPSPQLDPLLAAGPTAMRLFEMTAPRYPFEQSVPWQAAAQVPMPGPTSASGPTGFAAGGPSLWMLPQALRRVAAGPSGPTAATRPYDLLASTPAPPGATAAPTRLQRWSWATAIPLQITRARDEGGGFVAGTYELVGADENGTDLLLEAWRYLAAAGSRPGDRLYLLHPASAAAENDSGLVSDVIDPDATFVLRTNMSTETHSRQSSTLGGPNVAGEFFARASSIEGFLRAAWEASVTGSGGFHLSYATEDGEALPEELFASDGTASLWAVLVLERQGSGTSPARGLYPFNNCAIVADNVAAAADAIFAELSRPERADERPVASVPPGVVGFGLARHQPTGATAAGPTGLTRNLHSLVGYQVKGGADFAGSNEGLPVAPLDEPPPWLEVQPGATAHAYWSYVEGIPIAQFGAVVDPPSSPALPPAAETPYRGITGPAPGATRPLSKATVEFQYHDVFGNTTAATYPLPPLDLPVGYTDEVIGIGTWPGAGMDYLFVPAGGDRPGVLLKTELSLHAERYLPGSGVSIVAARETAKADAERYAAIFYQLGQPDVEARLSCNLGTARQAPGDLKAACAAFVTKAKLLADTAATLEAVTCTTTAGQTLDAVASHLAVTPAALLAANPEVEATKLFPGLYVKPRIIPAPPMNTLEALAGQVIVRSDAAPEERACEGTDPDPSRAASAKPAGGTAKGVAAENSTVPLTPGVTLRTATRTSPLLKRAGDLATVAAGLGTPVYGEVVNPDEPKGSPLAVGLVADNWKTAGLFTVGVNLNVAGKEHTTTAIDSLESVYEAFSPPSAPTLTVGEFALAIEHVEGLLAAGAKFAYASMLVPQPPAPSGPEPPTPTYSLADVPTEAGEIPFLANLNRRVANFFHEGSPLLLGRSCCKAPEGSTPISLARDAAVSLEQLASYNGLAAIGAGVELTVSELARLPSPRSCWAAFGPGEGDSLETVAAALGAKSLALAEANRELLGALEPGGSATIEGKTVAVTAQSTLDSLFEGFGALIPGLSWEAFVEKLAPQPGVLRKGGALVGPLPTVPTGKPTPALAGLAADLGVSAVALVGANRSLQGFLRDGAEVAGPAGASVAVGAFDTPETVLRRLRAKHPKLDLDELVELNQERTGLLAPGAPLLLPPVPVGWAPQLAPEVPPRGATGEAAMVFPVEVSATISRAPGLLHPDFAANEEVLRATTALGPRMAGSGGAALALDGFAEEFEAAFAEQRLKCAVAAGSQKSDQARIWAVNFGPGGVSNLAVEPNRPAFYSLPPLSTKPLSGEFTIPEYVSGQGLGPTATRRFDAVDLDDWMRQLLETVDLFLTPGFSVPAFRGAAGPPGAAAPGPTAPDGPRDYARIAAAKQSIAESLRDRVAPIVEAPGATGPHDWSVARDALYQQMLVRLSSAYDVSAVVQMPVVVESPVQAPPGPTGYHPPRVFGKVVPSLRTVPREGAEENRSIAAVAAAYGVSAPYLAEAIADVRGVLEVGVKIDGKTVEPQDTLAALAPAKPEDWAEWSAFVAGIAAQPVFVAGASFPLAASARTLGPFESLLNLAEFFGRDPASVARANQDLRGLVPTGELKLKPDFTKPYAVKPADTLLDVAAGLAAANQRPLELDRLADLLVTNGVRLSAGLGARIVEALPEMSLSTAKVSLGRVKEGNTPPPLSFLLSVKRPEEQGKLLLNLDYAISELEHGIEDVPGAGSYQASSWLTFPRPFAGGDKGAEATVRTAIPQIQVPIPLRAYPRLPNLTGQSGMPSKSPPPTIAAARQWDYRFDFELNTASQDSDHVEVRFGSAREALAAGFAADRLFPALAAFAAAYPLLKDDLALLATLGSDSSSPVARYAVQALSYLAEGVARALRSGVMPMAAPGPTGEVYAYRLTTLSDGKQLKTLRLDPAAPGPTGASAIWPQMLAKSPTAPTGGTGPDMGYVPLPGERGLYDIPPGFSAEMPAIGYRALFPGRDVIQDAEAAGRVAVSRNDRLIPSGPLGPTGPTSPVPTLGGFVYRTPWVEPVNPLVPLIESGVPIDVAALGPVPGPKPLEKHLLALLEAAIGVEGGGRAQMAELLCGYGYKVVDGEAGDISVGTPILFVAAEPIGPLDAEFAQRLAASLKRWRTSAGVDPARGQLSFELSVFTGSGPSSLARREDAPLGASAAAPLKPILRLANLRLEMKAISDWSAE